MSEFTVSLITVNYNETPSTCALLDNLRSLPEYPRLQVIVVDNASRENPEKLFRSRYPEVHFLRSEQNLGFAGGNNLALPVATGDYLFFVNNDALLEPGCIPALLDCFAEQPPAGIVSPLICYFPETTGPQIIQYAGMTQVSPLSGRNRTIGEREPDHGQFAHPRPSAYAHGAAMMVSRKALVKAGSMWEGFFLYYEELDWCERIRRSGFEIWVEPRARVLHKESLTLGKMGDAKTYFLTRNRIVFMRRNFGAWQNAVFCLFLLLVTLPKNLLSYTLKRDFTNLKAFLRGLRDGFKPMPSTKKSPVFLSQPSLRHA